MRHFMRHSTILCVTQPSHASLNHLRQDIDFINNFDTIWSSKWLWSIIFSSESDYLDDKTFQHMHVTCLKDEISIGPQGLVCICAHPIYIWICWFGRFAFVKPSRQVISTLPLERRWISPKKFMDFPNPIICICSQVIYPHLSESVVFFTAHQSEFICPTHFHSALLTVWWMVTERNIWWWMVMDKGMEHRRISPKKKLYLPTPIICICRQVISTFVRVSTSAFDIPVTLSDCWVWCSFCKQATQKK